MDTNSIAYAYGFNKGMEANGKWGFCAYKLLGGAYMERQGRMGGEICNGCVRGLAMGKCRK